ncbi:branched-chain amino acid transport system permease protein [Desulfuromusa kysingii]|uniref:Branched-chain amino acid transport system permease protein n=1 Tax=Desulfuromusa kysingii TaxID=37625 RepID=A0A1H3X4A4_9BACT|nr:branched-chain amino acid ABC transporter permease [Desulfuromusa kysingii]SDZ93454.1 branched-chain amino acid transport system permease protein [Desulfuromusa kysingii]
MKKYTFNILLVAFAIGLLFATHFRMIDGYIQIVVMTIGINIMMSTSLNLVNGNMGEFTCGHAAFMCVGAYVSSILSVICFGTKFGDPLLPAASVVVVFPLILLIGGAVAAVSSLLISIPSFKTRDDYLAIISIAVNYMIISAIENMDFVGGSRGFQGMKDTVWAMVDLFDGPWMLFWVINFTIFTVWVIRRFISSTYGKGVNAICQDEVAAEIMSVNTNKIKIINFMVAAGLAGCAGGLYAHIVGYVNPQSFNILKSTEALVMVYLGGMGSLSGAIISAIIFTGLLEVLRSQAIVDGLLSPITFMFPDWEPSAGVIKWVMIPLMLVIVMQFRPEGIMGNRELGDVFPKLKKFYRFK